jgi:hypothetical protein
MPTHLLPQTGRRIPFTMKDFLHIVKILSHTADAKTTKGFPARTLQCIKVPRVSNAIPLLIVGFKKLNQQRIVFVWSLVPHRLHISIQD